ncbi:MAG: small, acid-soluble spore protein, alpha/beta type [Peptococcaceae bacterium]|jgi:hypothetical protein|nr:small, acid-soluble spore protein, alpha/beta type [Peptococcaceae bacterium]
MGFNDPNNDQQKVPLSAELEKFKYEVAQEIAIANKRNIQLIKQP